MMRQAYLCSAPRQSTLRMEPLVDCPSVVSADDDLLCGSVTRRPSTLPVFALIVCDSSGLRLHDPRRTQLNT